MDLHDSIIEILKTGASQAKVVHQPGYTPAVLAPEGYVLQPLEIAKPLPADPPPEFITARPLLQTPEAFGAYVQKFKSPATIIFWTRAQLEGTEWTTGCYDARLDYHAPDAPNRLKHSAYFRPEFSPQAKAWLSINGKATEQLALMRFLDEHMPEVVQPDGAVLYEVARTLEIASHGRFASRIDRTTEGRSLTWTEEATTTAGNAGNKIVVPEIIEVIIPVFEGLDIPQRFTGKLIYEVNKSTGQLNITIRLLRIHLPILSASAQMHEAVIAAVGGVTMIEGEA